MERNRFGLDLSETQVIITTEKEGMQKVDYLIPGGEYPGDKVGVIDARIREHEDKIKLEKIRIKLLRAGVIGVTAIQGIQLFDAVEDQNIPLIITTSTIITVMAGLRNYIIGTALDRVDAANGRLHGLQVEKEMLKETSESGEIFPAK